MPRARLLPARAHRPPGQGTGLTATTCNALAACLSRVLGQLARTDLRGRGRGNASPLPGRPKGQIRTLAVTHGADHIVMTWVALVWPGTVAAFQAGRAGSIPVARSIAL